ncbi:MAG TPA: SEC-C metal-binding domain-containing protein [Candidatus Angelobacter sp.]|nr:SEC-C metal-binding domain-containing protein [Candidatus Angelobacter sp.]
MSNAAFRTLRGGMKDLREKLGRNDPCPCGSLRKFQEVLYEIGAF